MFLPQRFNKFSPPQFIGTASAGSNSPILGTTQKWQIPRTWPIEELILRVCFTVSTATLAPIASPTTPDQFDGILTLLQHINLSVNDGKQPRSVIDANGIALLEFQASDGPNLDMGTRAIMALSQGAGLPVGNYTLTYRVSMVDSSIGEPLRSRLYLPVHTHPQDPVLTLNFQSAGNLGINGFVNNVYVDVLVIGRQVTPQSEATLQKSPVMNPNGYIDWDLIETPFAIPLGTAAVQRFALPLPGSYLNLLFRHYKGGASAITRAEIDNGAPGTSFGQEGRWDIETASNAIREFNWQQLRILTEANQPLFPSLPNFTTTGGWLSATSGTTTSVNLGSLTNVLQNTLLGKAGTSFPANQGYCYANGCWLDFLGDSNSSETGRELGSVLDCNTPANTGLKMELVGTPALVSSGYASQLYAIGRRLFGDLSRWQKFA